MAKCFVIECAFLFYYTPIFIISTNQEKQLNVNETTKEAAGEAAAEEKQSQQQPAEAAPQPVGGTKKKRRLRLRFPLHQSFAIGKYIFGQKLRLRKQFPLVLMLEPLHRCNLACKGCGRINEYRDTMNLQMSLEECLAAANECNTPVVSVAGGEPLIYPHIVELVEGLTRDQRRYVYLCTNALKLEEMASKFTPHKRFLFNVHLDGPAELHDAITCRKGVFEQACKGIAEARRLGFRVTTNSTFYATTKIEDLDRLFAHLEKYDVEGHTVSPAYAFKDAAGADEFFLNKQMIKEQFSGLRDLAARYRLLTSPVYLDFLLKDKELPCAPWANPTRTVKGWRAPCYLLLDTHYPTFEEYREKVNWEALGPGNDPRCRDCMVHAGFEPSAATGGGKSLLDPLRMLWWQFG